jgi:hypothetical protein
MKMFKSIRPSNTVSAFFVLCAFLLAACNAPGTGGNLIASGSGVRVWLDQPPTGVGLPVGAFTLKAHARDTAGGGVQKIVFLVNTIPLGTVNTDSTQPLVYGEFGWNPSVPGQYQIQAQAFNSTGSALSEIAVVCVGPDCTQDVAPAPIAPQPFAIDPTPQTTCKGAPVISAFAATPATLTAAGSTMLSWSASNADRVELAGSGVVGLTGSQAASVSSTTTFNLVAYCGGKDNFVQKSVTVTVSAQAACSGLPVVAFSASPTTIDAGGSSTLRWTVTNASEVALVNVGVVGGTGSRVVAPGATTTYTLTAFCGSKTNLVEKSVTVTVKPPPPPPPPPQTGCSGTPNIAFFTALPATITAKDSSVLSWGAVTNADSVSIDQGIGGVPAPGSRTVSPGGTTIYTMTARCGNNAATKQATVTLNTAPPPPPPPPPQDTTPPAISGVKPNSSMLTYPSACSGYPNTLTVAASVTDPSGVASVQLYYRYVPSKGTASNWNAVTMSPLGGGSYSGTVNVGSQAYTPLGGGNGNVEYYVSARDNPGNSGNSSTSSVIIQYCPS